MIPSTSDTAALPALESVSPGLLVTDPAPGAWNMAVDAAVMDAVRSGAPPVLRFYRWDPPCLSLGRNQPARGHYDAAALRREGVDVVRRATGGRAVLHDRELTYSFVLPLRLFGSPRTIYRRVNRALVAGLRGLGVAADLAPDTGRRAPAPSAAPCFAEPVAGEVVAHGRKLVGSAQVVEGGVLLQHGSLPLDGDPDRITRFATDGAAPAPAGIRLADCLTSLPSWDALVGALARGWETELLTEAGRGLDTTVQIPDVAEYLVRFADPARTWQR